jgi:hypothetical protein
METFMSHFIVVFILQTFKKKMVQKRHSDVYRIEITIKRDKNVSITPPFLQGLLAWSCLWLCTYHHNSE